MEPLEQAQPAGPGPADAGAARGRQVAAAGARQAQPGADPRRCRQLPAERVRGRAGAARGGVTAHVVGLGLKPDDLAKMACLPQITGGRLFNAQNAEQIGSRRRGGAAAGQQRCRQDRACQPRRSGLARSRARGTERRDRAEAAGRCAARALSARPAGAESGAGQPAAALDRDGRRRAGASRVRRPRRQPARPGAAGPLRGRGARRAASSASTTADVGDKGPTVAEARPQRRHLAGQGAGAEERARRSAMPSSPISEAGQAARAGRMPPSAGRSPRSRAARAWRSCRPGAISCASSRGWCAPSGPWWCRPGARVVIDVPLNAARLQLSAAGTRSRASPRRRSSSASPRTTRTRRSGRREVARSAARQADFVLPPGTYYVIARHGSIEARESLAVGPGDVVKRTLSVAAGRLALATKPVGAGAGARASRSPTASSASTAPPRRRSRPAAPSPVLLLPAAATAWKAATG